MYSLLRIRQRENLSRIKMGDSEAGRYPRFYKERRKNFVKTKSFAKSRQGSCSNNASTVMAAMGRLLREEGYAAISYGDSEGVGHMAPIAKECGIADEMDKLNIPMGDFETCVLVENSQGKMAKQFHLAKAVTENSAIINISKMKTHQLEKMTGAVKNMYGCIQGFHKAKGHTIYNNAESFARMLVDLNQYLKPRLYIMDGIVAMEGNGPASGDPVSMGVILIATDPVALDSVACALMNLEADLVPTNVQGEKMGLGTYREESIEVITREGTCKISEIKARYGKMDYAVDRSRNVKKLWRNIRFIARHFQKKPYIVEDDCIRCGICVEACPVEGKAIILNRPKIPVYDYKKCIACFCCQEMCPQKAIKVR